MTESAHARRAEPALRSILCATDMEASAQSAARRALRLAREHQAQLHVAHVLGGSGLDALRGWLGGGSTAEAALQQQAHAQLRRWLEEAAQAPPGSGPGHEWMSTEVTAGSVPEQIAGVADRMGADLLVIGASSGPAVRHMLLGTTADRLLRRGQRPVLVVREEPAADYARVLVAVDFSAWSPLCLAWARRVAPRAHLVLHHAWSVPFEEKLQFAGVEAAAIQAYALAAQSAALRELHDLAAQQGLADDAWSPSLVRGDPDLLTAAAAQELDCDLIVVGKHGRHAAQDLLLGSVTRHVLADASPDVLVATLPAEAGS